ncbi:MAG: hypothetical protein LBV30_05410 [Propionibacteriaceae bacterium]|jgi:hypothetical protein|nr:hypothetical protein [Propionibacteriaceae bacterium]
MTAPSAQADCATTKSQTAYAVDIALSCATSTPTQAADTANRAADSAAPVCQTSEGTVIDCWRDNQAWMPQFQSYCGPKNLPAESALWANHQLPGHTPDTPYSCAWWSYPSSDDIYWISGTPNTPAKPDIDTDALVEQAIASLGIQPPQLQASAYVYPQWANLGLQWWIGAPMWFWINNDDPHRWGQQTTSITVQGITLTLTAKAQSITINPGDGANPITCANPFDARDRDSLLREHAPNGCEHTYMTINSTDDPNSRFQTSAYTNWNVTWTTSDNQSGQTSFTTPEADGPAPHINQLHVVETNPDQ